MNNETEIELLKAIRRNDKSIERLYKLTILQGIVIIVLGSGHIFELFL